MCSQRILTLSEGEDFYSFASLSLTETTVRGLIQQAIGARRNAHASNSGFRVGCALLTVQGNVFCGCNVEYDHYIVTHAERAALAAAVLGGQRHIKMLVLAGGPGDREFDLTSKEVDLTKVNSDDIVPPCGDCRHVISEHCNGDKSVAILSVTLNGGVFSTNIGLLYPHAFTL